MLNWNSSIGGSLDAFGDIRYTYLCNTITCAPLIICLINLGITNYKWPMSYQRLAWNEGSTMLMTNESS